jgi:hypothetical protein
MKSSVSIFTLTVLARSATAVAAQAELVNRPDSYERPWLYRYSAIRKRNQYTKYR